MYALVVDNSVTRVFPGPTGFEHNGNQYAPDIFYKWSKAEKEAIGLYEVETDSTNYKDENWYINTNESFTFGSGKVTRSWGTATAKDYADKDAVDNEGNKIKDEDGNQVIIEGLKTIKKRMIDNQCAGLLAPSDWRVVKATETGGTMDSGWKTWRASVRTKCNSMQTQIDNASDVDALAALFTRDKDGVRPLGDFPVKE